MKKITFGLLLAALFQFSILKKTSAQRLVFSQYRTMPYLLNPATTGHLKKDQTQRLSLLLRNHWNLPKTSRTASLGGVALGWDRRFCNRSSDHSMWSLGAFVQHNGTSDGGIRHTQARAMGSLSHSFLGDSWISFGVSAGGMQYGFDPKKLTFDRQYNPATGVFDLPSSASGEDFLRENALGWDLDAGVRIFSQDLLARRERRGRQAADWAAGFSIHHLNSPKYHFLKTGDDRRANQLVPGFSVQAEATVFNGHLAVNALFWRQSFAESRQWQAMFGAAKVFELENENLLSSGAQLRLASRESGLDFFATRQSLTLLVDWLLAGAAVRGSWDIGLSRIGSRPPNGFELGLTWFFGDGKCPVNCP